MALMRLLEMHSIYCSLGPSSNFVFVEYVLNVLSQSKIHCSNKYFKIICNKIHVHVQ